MLDKPESSDGSIISRDVEAGLATGSLLLGILGSTFFVVVVVVKVVVVDDVVPSATTCDMLT